jgi:hypothetical protein
MNARVDDLPLDGSDDVDWDEIIAELPEDIASEPYAFCTGDYPTDEEGMAALWKWLCTLGNGASNEAGACAPDAKGA